MTSVYSVLAWLITLLTFSLSPSTARVGRRMGADIGTGNISGIQIGSGNSERTDNGIHASSNSEQGTRMETETTTESQVKIEARITLEDRAQVAVAAPHDARRLTRYGTLSGNGVSGILRRPGFQALNFAGSGGSNEAGIVDKVKLSSAFLHGADSSATAKISTVPTTSGASALYKVGISSGSGSLLGVEAQGSVKNDSNNVSNIIGAIPVLENLSGVASDIESLNAGAISSLQVQPVTLYSGGLSGIISNVGTEALNRAAGLDNTAAVGLLGAGGLTGSLSNIGTGALNVAHHLPTISIQTASGAPPGAEGGALSGSGSQIAFLKGDGTEVLNDASGLTGSVPSVADGAGGILTTAMQTAGGTLSGAGSPIVTVTGEGIGDLNDAVGVPSGTSASSGAERLVGSIADVGAGALYNVVQTATGALSRDEGLIGSVTGVGTEALNDAIGVPMIPVQTTAGASSGVVSLTGSIPSVATGAFHMPGGLFTTATQTAAGAPSGAVDLIGSVPSIAPTGAMNMSGGSLTMATHTAAGILSGSGNPIVFFKDNGVGASNDASNLPIIPVRTPAAVPSVAMSLIGSAPSVDGEALNGAGGLLTTVMQTTGGTSPGARSPIVSFTGKGAGDLNDAATTPSGTDTSSEAGGLVGSVTDFDAGALYNVVQTAVGGLLTTKTAAGALSGAGNLNGSVNGVDIGIVNDVPSRAGSVIASIPTIATGALNSSGGLLTTAMQTAVESSSGAGDLIGSVTGLEMGATNDTSGFHSISLQTTAGASSGAGSLIASIPSAATGAFNSSGILSTTATQIAVGGPSGAGNLIGSVATSDLPLISVQTTASAPSGAESLIASIPSVASGALNSSGGLLTTALQTAAEASSGAGDLIASIPSVTTGSLNLSGIPSTTATQTAVGGPYGAESLIASIPSAATGAFNSSGILSTTATQIAVDSPSGAGNLIGSVTTSDLPLISVQTTASAPSGAESLIASIPSVASGALNSSGGLLTTALQTAAEASSGAGDLIASIPSVTTGLLNMSGIPSTMATQTAVGGPTGAGNLIGSVTTSDLPVISVHTTASAPSGAGSLIASIPSVATGALNSSGGLLTTASHTAAEAPSGAGDLIASISSVATGEFNSSGIPSTTATQTAVGGSSGAGNLIGSVTTSGLPIISVQTTAGTSSGAGSLIASIPSVATGALNSSGGSLTTALQTAADAQSGAGDLIGSITGVSTGNIDDASGHPMISVQTTAGAPSGAGSLLSVIPSIASNKVQISAGALPTAGGPIGTGISNDIQNGFAGSRIVTGPGMRNETVVETGEEVIAGIEKGSNVKLGGGMNEGYRMGNDAEMSTGLELESPGSIIGNGNEHGAGFELGTLSEPVGGLKLGADSHKRQAGGIGLGLPGPLSRVPFISRMLSDDFMSTLLSIGSIAESIQNFLGSLIADPFHRGRNPALILKALELSLNVTVDSLTAEDKRNMKIALASTLDHCQEVENFVENYKASEYGEPLSPITAIVSGIQYYLCQLSKTSSRTEMQNRINSIIAAIDGPKSGAEVVGRVETRTEAGSVAGIGLGGGISVFRFPFARFSTSS